MLRRFILLLIRQNKGLWNIDTSLKVITAQRMEVQRRQPEKSVKMIGFQRSLKSTAQCTPVLELISPLTMKQPLRMRSKQKAQFPKQPKNLYRNIKQDNNIACQSEKRRKIRLKTTIKTCPSIHMTKQKIPTSSEGQVDWMVYNMLIGVYSNWLRVAPLIQNKVKQAKKDKIETLEKLIEQIKLRKQQLTLNKQRLQANRKYTDKIKNTPDLQESQQKQPSYKESEIIPSQFSKHKIAQSKKDIQFIRDIQLHVCDFRQNLMDLERRIKIEKENAFIQKFLNTLTNTKHKKGWSQSVMTASQMSQSIVQFTQILTKRADFIQRMSKTYQNSLKNYKQLISMPFRTINAKKQAVSSWNLNEMIEFMQQNLAQLNKNPSFKPITGKPNSGSFQGPASHTYLKRRESILNQKVNSVNKSSKYIASNFRLEKLKRRNSKQKSSHEVQKENHNGEQNPRPKHKPPKSFYSQSKASDVSSHCNRQQIQIKLRKVRHSKTGLVESTHQQKDHQRRKTSNIRNTLLTPDRYNYPSDEYNLRKNKNESKKGTHLSIGNQGRYQFSRRVLQRVKVRRGLNLKKTQWIQQSEDAHRRTKKSSNFHSQAFRGSRSNGFERSSTGFRTKKQIKTIKYNIDEKNRTVLSQNSRISLVSIPSQNSVSHSRKPARVSISKRIPDTRKINPSSFFYEQEKINAQTRKIHNNILQIILNNQSEETAFQLKKGQSIFKKKEEIMNAMSKMIQHGYFQAKHLQKFKVKYDELINKQSQRVNNMSIQRQKAIKRISDIPQKKRFARASEDINQLQIYRELSEFREQANENRKQAEEKCGQGQVNVKNIFRRLSDMEADPSLKQQTKKKTCCYQDFCGECSGNEYNFGNKRLWRRHQKEVAFISFMLEFRQQFQKELLQSDLD